MPPLLSICIPTYNRAHRLPDAIRSVLREATDEVELVISDNGSADDTAAVVAREVGDFPRLTYYRSPDNQGADRNFLKVVQLARGDYCWFLSSDDALAPGGITRMLQALREGADIYLCNSSVVGDDLVPRKTNRRLRGMAGDATFDLADKRDLIRYFDHVRNLDGLFSYLGAICFRRAKWVAVGYDEAFTGTLYSHVFMLFSMRSQGCRLKYLHEPLMLTRFGETERGNIYDGASLERRMLVDFDGFELIEDKLFRHDADIHAAYARVLRRSFRYRAIEWRSVFSREAWARIEPRLTRYGFSRPKLRLHACLSFAYAAMMKLRVRVCR